MQDTKAAQAVAVKDADANRKVDYVRRLARVCEMHTRLNFFRDLPKLEQNLVRLTGDLFSAVQGMSGLDPRKLGAKRRYEKLVEGTQFACQFFKAYLRNKTVEGHKVTQADVMDILTTWINDLNVWTAPEIPGSKPIWNSMGGKKIKLVEKRDPTVKGRFVAVDEFSIAVEQTNN